MTQIFNKASHKHLRRELRNNMTSAEGRLWLFLQKKQLNGCRFRRQYGVDSYILDFYCPDLKIAIEVDGDSHFEESAREKDFEREQFLQSLGILTLRFTNQEVFDDLEGILEKIQEFTKR